MLRQAMRDDFSSPLCLFLNMLLTIGIIIRERETKDGLRVG